VIVHVGFAISRLDEEEALRTLEMLRTLDELMVQQELGAMPADADGVPMAGAADPAAGVAAP